MKVDMKMEIARLLAENSKLRSRKGQKYSQADVLAGNQRLKNFLSDLKRYGVPGATKQQVEAVLKSAEIPLEVLDGICMLGEVKNLARRGAVLNFVLVD